MSKDLVEVKSEFDAEFRRFSIVRTPDKNFLEFYQTVEKLHNLKDIPFVVFYTDPVGDLLPITNNDNFRKALATSVTVLRLSVQRKDENWSDLIGYSTLNRKKDKTGQNKILSQLPLSYHTPNKSSNKKKSTPLKIGMPEDFRQVSAIIDVDKVPQHYRRVRLLKHGSDKPLGFYIRDGINIKVTPTGLDKIPGIFISRLVAGGLAESTGLISVNDEIVEVNGIEVANKTLDQVTDMMIANSSNLIITVKPANQRLSSLSGSSLHTTDGSSLYAVKPANQRLSPLTGSSPYTTEPDEHPSSPHSVRNTNQRLSQISAGSTASYTSSNHSVSQADNDDDMDEIRDFHEPHDLPTARDALPLGLVKTSSGSSGCSNRTSSSSSSTAGSESGGKRKRMIIINSRQAGKTLADGGTIGSLPKQEQLFTL